PTPLAPRPLAAAPASPPVLASRKAVCLSGLGPLARADDIRFHPAKPEYTDGMPDVTQLLDAAAAGDPRAAAELLPLVYDELRKLAAARMAAEAPGQTLQPTALVHEAYLRLVGDQHFNGRGHFFGAAAEAMRRILVDRARARQRLKRGGGG